MLISFEYKVEFVTKHAQVTLGVSHTTSKCTHVISGSLLSYFCTKYPMVDYVVNFTPILNRYKTHFGSETVPLAARPHFSVRTGPVFTDVLQCHPDGLYQAAEAPAGILLHHMCHHLRTDSHHPVQKSRNRRLLWLPHRRRGSRLFSKYYFMYTSVTAIHLLCTHNV